MASRRRLPTRRTFAVLAGVLLAVGGVVWIAASHMSVPPPASIWIWPPLPASAVINWVPPMTTVALEPGEQTSEFITAVGVSFVGDPASATTGTVEVFLMHAPGVVGIARAVTTGHLPGENDHHPKYEHTDETRAIAGKTWQRWALKEK